ncbi:MAG: hypothetical protein ABFC80_09505 [Coriobacteriales bacterium]
MARQVASVAAVVALSVAFAVLTGCTHENRPSAGSGSGESTAAIGAADAGQVPAARPSPTPEKAVEAFLTIAARSYYSLDSTMVAPYVTPDQWVREDAYIQLNLMQNQAIEMKLEDFSATQGAPSSAEATTATVRTREVWRWRYWDLVTRKPKTEWAKTGYSMLYTLERVGSGWLVASTKVLEQSGDTSPTVLE